MITLSKYTVKIVSLIDKEGGHWIWKGPLQAGGYPYLSTPKGLVYVRAAMWRAWSGESSPRVTRTCAESLCVKPEHAAPFTGIERIPAQ